MDDLERLFEFLEAPYIVRGLLVMAIVAGTLMSGLAIALMMVGEWPRG